MAITVFKQLSQPTLAGIEGSSSLINTMYNVYCSLPHVFYSEDQGLATMVSEVVNFLVVDIEIHVLFSRSKECSMLRLPAYVIHIGFHSRSDFLLLIIMRHNLFICLLDTL